MRTRPLVVGALALIAAAAGAAVPALATQQAFRATSLQLRDPHMYAPVIGCLDVTNSGVGFPSFNARLADALSNDGDGDGLLDLGLVIVFDDLATAPGATGTLRFGGADCTAPATGASCAGSSLYTLSFTNPVSGTCLEPEPGTTTASYTPPVTVTSHPCFVTEAADVTIDLAGLSLVLAECRIAATYVGDPAQLQLGLISGFVPADVAANTILPGAWGFAGGASLASVLPGGSGNCASHSDLDTGPGGARGWWFYINFIAAPVPFDNPAAATPPSRTALLPAYPNPFNPSVSLPFTLAEGAHARLSIFDVTGARVAVLLDATLAAGGHTARWDGRDTGGAPMASGVYVARLETGADTFSRKIVLLK